MIHFAMNPTPEGARLLTDYRLHEAIRLSDRGQYHVQAIAEAELRRREAWRAPAGRAFWISIVSVLIAFGALAIAIIK
ncbi:hypothetical protein [Sphingomonas swuensis]